MACVVSCPRPEQLCCQALGGYRQRIEFSHDCIHANITVMGKTLEATALRLCACLVFRDPKFNSWSVVLWKFSSRARNS